MPLTQNANLKQSEVRNSQKPQEAKAGKVSTTQTATTEKIRSAVLEKRYNALKVPSNSMYAKNSSERTSCIILDTFEQVYSATQEKQAVRETFAVALDDESSVVRAKAAEELASIGSAFPDGELKAVVRWKLNELQSDKNQPKEVQEAVRSALLKIRAAAKPFVVQEPAPEKSSTQTEVSSAEKVYRGLKSPSNSIYSKDDDSGRNPKIIDTFATMYDFSKEKEAVRTTFAVALDDQDPKVRAKAAEAIAATGKSYPQDQLKSATIWKLEQLLADTSQPAQVSVSVKKALSVLKPKEKRK